MTVSEVEINSKSPLILVSSPDESAAAISVLRSCVVSAIALPASMIMRGGMSLL